MRRAAAVSSLVILLLGACGSSEPEATGGIVGRVLAGPTCPIETVGSPCPPAPWGGTVRATAADGSTYETQAGADGRYSLALAPGSYVVTAVTETGGPPTGIAEEITVVAGPPLVLDLQVDTGIR